MNKRILLLALLWAVLSASSFGQTWKRNSSDNPFDGKYRAAYTIGKGGEFPYSKPKFVINWFEKSGTNFYFNNIGYAGCDNKIISIKFKGSEEIHRYLVSTNNNKEAWFFDINESERMAYVNMIKKYNTMYVRVSSNCGEKDYEFSLSGASSAIDFVLKYWYKDMALRKEQQKKAEIEAEERQREKLRRDHIRDSLKAIEVRIQDSIRAEQIRIRDSISLEERNSVFSKKDSICNLHRGVDFIITINSFKKYLIGEISPGTVYYQFDEEKINYKVKDTEMHFFANKKYFMSSDEFCPEGNKVDTIIFTSQGFLIAQKKRNSNVTMYLGRTTGTNTLTFISSWRKQPREPMRITSLTKINFVFIDTTISINFISPDVAYTHKNSFTSSNKVYLDSNLLNNLANKRLKQVVLHNVYPSKESTISQKVKPSLGEVISKEAMDLRDKTSGRVNIKRADLLKAQPTKLKDIYLSEMRELMKKNTTTRDAITLGTIGALILLL